MVRIPTEIDDKNIFKVIQKLQSITGIDIWRRREKGLRSEITFNPICEDFILERYGLELAFEEVRQYRKKTGRYLWPPKTVEQYKIYSFAAAFTEVHKNLSPMGQRRVVGAIHKSLEKDFGFGPLEYEFTIALSLMRNGFDIHFNDYEEAGGFHSDEVSIVITLRSQKADHVLTSMINKIDHDIKKQFSKSRPGILCVHLSDLNEKELTDLNSPKHRNAAINNAFSTLLDKRSFLHTIALTASGGVYVSKEQLSHGRLRSVKQQNVGYTIRNPQHPNLNSPILNSIF